jgi:hypothetical protein
MRWSPLQVQGSIQTGQVGAGGGMVSAPSPPPAAATSISVVAGTPESDGIGADIGERFGRGVELTTEVHSGVNGERLFFFFLRCERLWLVLRLSREMEEAVG